MSHEHGGNGMGWEGAYGEGGEHAMLFDAQAHVQPGGQSNGGVAACESSVGGGAAAGDSGVAHEMIDVGRDAASGLEHDVCGGVGTTASTAASSWCAQGGSGSGGGECGVEGDGSGATAASGRRDGSGVIAAAAVAAATAGKRPRGAQSGETVGSVGPTGGSMTGGEERAAQLRKKQRAKRQSSAARQNAARGQRAGGEVG